MRTLRWMVVCALVVLIPACSSGDDSDAASDTSRDVTSSTSSGETTTSAAPETTTTTTGPSTTADDALAFFQGTESECADHAAATSNPVVEPERFADAEVGLAMGEDRWLIEDGLGTILVVDLGVEQIYSVLGPSGIMPFPYSFGCPPELYVGTLPS